MIAAPDRSSKLQFAYPSRPDQKASGSSQWLYVNTVHAGGFVSDLPLDLVLVMPWIFCGNISLE